VETAKAAVAETIKYTKAKAEILQQKYYKFLAECSSSASEVPKRHF